ncbi:tellurium resistance protein TerE [Burkholderia aenigmatica]|uniref:TerD family protein n=1 Tax=Burkholderia cepacia complex TaxID=87882 RepID=UPI000F086512|nr:MULTISPECIES: TerD family protein [Burkholderia cepacia complex]AYQ41722.1 hypothetical protein CVS37_27700 [Burkholderia lata]VWC91712.1 tellurium resistance protein TerE [Burkholderia aenigmatica]
MTVSLPKGGNVSLSTGAPGLREAFVGPGWSPRVNDGTEFDLDASTCGERYRQNDEFKFKAIGQGFAGGLKPLAEAHGVSIG